MLLDETVRNLRAVFLYLWFRLVSMKPLYDFRAQLVHRLCTARRPETGNGSGGFLCNEPQNRIAQAFLVTNLRAGYSDIGKNASEWDHVTFKPSASM